MKENESLYKVWFDPTIEDFIAIEKEQITLNLLINLNKEGIKVKEVSATNRYDALGKVFPHLTRLEKIIREEPYYKKPKLSIIK